MASAPLQPNTEGVILPSSVETCLINECMRAVLDQDGLVSSLVTDHVARGQYYVASATCSLRLSAGKPLLMARGTPAPGSTVRNITANYVVLSQRSVF
jgi:hypothetical protein